MKDFSPQAKRRDELPIPSRLLKSGVPHYCYQHDNYMHFHIIHASVFKHHTGYLNDTQATMTSHPIR